MKKIISVVVATFFCSTILVAQEKRKVATKKPSNFSWGASNPTTQAKTTDVAIETLEATNGKKPQANKNGQVAKRQHKPRR